ncbi:hypothetical protein SmJEL517_g00391 [Synchytrium microbalum]|uniref:Uncharacterized protein n=1 Tax=Synchytrium microbalum TaxID=1806994 RepID=A0A507CEG8_9FUNG|nr:uncharacterized protein SmJEL517_g00391 [Synchytrium microbalum]TPX38022.1 hypothetical protein SmJEL517_g00391 [Synchytrium microbalum]
MSRISLFRNLKVAASRRPPCIRYSSTEAAKEPSPIMQAVSREQTEIVYSVLHRLRRSAFPLMLWLTLGSIALELRWARNDYREYRQDVTSRTRHLERELEMWRSKVLGIESPEALETTVTAVVEPLEIVKVVEVANSEKAVTDASTSTASTPPASEFG